MLGWTIRPRLYENGISAEYLSEMAAKGWRLKGLGFNFVFFKKSASARLRYAVDVITSERVKYDERISSSHVQEYIQFCEDSGWRLAGSDGTFYVFETADETAPPLQTDSAAYESTLYRQRKGSLGNLLLTALLLFVLMKEIFFAPHLILAWRNGPLIWLGGMLLFGSVFLRAVCVLQRIIREKQILSKGAIPGSRQSRWLVWLDFIVEWSAAGIVLTAAIRQFGGNVPILLPLLLPVIFFGIMALESLQTALWKRFHWTRGEIKALTLLVIFSLNLLLRLGPDLLRDQGVLPEREAGPPEGWQAVVTAADFGWDVEDGEPRVIWDESSLARMYEAWEGSGTTRLRTIWYASDISLLVNAFVEKGPSYTLGNYTLGNWWNEENVSECVELDAGRLGADMALYWYTDSVSIGRQYLLRVGNSALFLSAGQELTEEQLRLAASRLRR